VAETLGGDHAAFHVDTNGARDIDQALLAAPIKLPVTVRETHHCARSQTPFEGFAGFTGYFGGSGLDGGLHFRDGRDGHVGR
jgi:hypothetical protein